MVIERIILNEVLANTFVSNHRYTYDEYLLCRKFTKQNNDFLRPLNRCTCKICDCSEPCDAISEMNDDIYEQASLNRHCFDCFVICEGRKKGW